MAQANLVAHENPLDFFTNLISHEICPQFFTMGNFSPEEFSPRNGFALNRRQTGSGKP
jgi:hypothetical protein